MNKNSPIITNKNIKTDFKENIHWGKNIIFGSNCKKVSIGYGCFIGNDIYIDVEELNIGDYVTIHHGTVLHGVKCNIGHNNWIGHYCILDSLGGLLSIGNNVGIGAHSQLWTHMRFGDRLEGCQWYKNSSILVGDDVWIVGHCIVTAINAEAKSMLLIGSVALKDMLSNHIYAGSPAVDITDKIGTQFIVPTIDEKYFMMRKYINDYELKYNSNTNFLRLVDNFEGDLKNCYTYFNLRSREYIPRYTEEEYKFMKFLLYDKAKFIPFIVNAF